MNPNDLKRLKQTLQRLTFIIEQLNEGVAVTDLNGTIHFANPAMARMHGCELMPGTDWQKHYALLLGRSDTNSS